MVFEDTHRKYLFVRYEKTFLEANKANKTYSSYSCFDLDLFVKAVIFVINEVYVVFGGLVFNRPKVFLWDTTRPISGIMIPSDMGYCVFACKSSA